MQKAQIRAIQFLKAGEDTPKMLDFVDETFDQMALSIQPSIILAQDFRPLMGWDHRLDAPRQQILDKICRCITTIGNQALERQPLQQRLRLRTIVALSGSQTHTQGVAQAIHCHMDFAAKPAPATSQRLRPAFFVRLPRMDGHVQSCCQSSRSPYPGQRQNGSAAVPTHPTHTSA